ncbi:hypothetical protein [Paractinoplanes lichenicola]|uniref:Uncharacterized protein n=1 Tax=Paractinoplanes lichenicola TaxID=2802976 RepID=A0ABS1VRE4_9ACTN|nr:hypothetical protein [Actinoplanes lichenicola]MBL7257291.1 hypothetical protein [Actinoplanes lichenicola]
MKAERSITAVRHSAGRTIDELTKFATAVLTARRYPHAEQVGAQLRSLTPLFNLVLATRAAGAPALLVGTRDMQIGLHLDYDMNAEENLSVPPMDLLEELPADAQVEVTVQVTQEVAPALAELVRKADGKPALITLTVTPAEQPEQSDVPESDVPPEAEPSDTPEDRPRPEDSIPQQKTPDEEMTQPLR